jgi:hypothetical protein
MDFMDTLFSTIHNALAALAMLAAWWWSRKSKTKKASEESPAIVIVIMPIQGTCEKCHRSLSGKSKRKKK